ncbi:hypothetical protein QJQ45_011725 [Haematococcus lacustris]|nr:hypothetical protein QJQ45_011725 [Haematococcus lacustris]
MVDHVGKQLETAFSNMLTLLFAGRLKKSVSLAGAKVLVVTNEHQRRFGFRGLGGGHLPAWSKRQCTYVRRMVCGLDVSWLLEEGGVVPTAAMQAEVALQRGLLGLREGEEVDHDWVEDPANRGRLLRHAMHTTREMEAAMAAWRLDMVPWQQAELISHGLLPRPPRPPTPYALTPTSKCSARHIFIDTKGLYGMMRDAGMLGVLTEEGVTSLKKFRNGALPNPAEPGKFIEGPKDSQVANRWDALLPDPRRQKLASPKQSFAQIVHTDGVALSVMFLRPKPAAPPAEPPRMGKHMGAANPLAHLDAEWLGVDPGKSNMATVVHEERSAAGTVASYYRDSGITRQSQATKTWLAQVKPQLNALLHVSSKPSSLASYRRFADTVLETYDAMWAEVSKPRWANAKFRLYRGKKRVVARFWSMMLKEALRQFPAGRVVMVDEFRTSRVSSAYSHPSEALPGQPPESFRWLRPVYSSAKRSRVRGLMCSASNNIRFYDRDVSAALNIRRCAVGPGPRPTELCYWDGRPAMPKPGQPGQARNSLSGGGLVRLEPGCNQLFGQSGVNVYRDLTISGQPDSVLDLAYLVHLLVSFTSVGHLHGSMQPKDVSLRDAPVLPMTPVTVEHMLGVQEPQTGVTIVLSNMVLTDATILTQEIIIPGFLDLHHDNVTVYLESLSMASAAINIVPQPSRKQSSKRMAAYGTCLYQRCDIWHLHMQNVECTAYQQAEMALGSAATPLANVSNSIYIANYTSDKMVVNNVTLSCDASMATSGVQLLLDDGPQLLANLGTLAQSNTFAVMQITNDVSLRVGGIQALTKEPTLIESMQGEQKPQPDEKPVPGVPNDMVMNGLWQYAYNRTAVLDLALKPQARLCFIKAATTSATATTSSVPQLHSNMQGVLA